MCLARGPQHSEAGEAPTRVPSVLSQALYPWATELPNYVVISMKTVHLFAELGIFQLVLGLFDLILYIPVNNLQICRDRSSWVEPIPSKD